MVNVVKENEYDKEVAKSSIPVILDCFADWCGPCKNFAPIFEEVSKDHEGQIKFLKLNVDESADVAGNLGIRSIPTVIFLKDGKEVNRRMGMMDKVALNEFIENCM